MTNALWYLGRGTGVSALVLLTMVVVLGVVLRAGKPLPGLPRFAVLSIHRTVSLSAVLLLVVHVTTLYADPYAQLRLVDLVVPFLGAYRPFWLGLGTLSAELIVLLTVSSLLRHRLGLRTWRALHWTAYACWPFALLHAVGNGTDRHTPWLLALAGGCAAIGVVTLGWRGYVVSQQNKAVSLDNPRPIPHLAQERR
jgi:predicted ferric reductase